MSLIFKLGTVSTYLTEFTFTKVNLQSCGPRAKGNAAAAAFPDASTLSGARAPFRWFGLVRGLIGHPVVRTMDSFDDAVELSGLLGPEPVRRGVSVWLLTPLCHLSTKL